MSTFIGFLMAIMAVFLILLVLVQRGRGGGLAGALGGAGGSSAFGAKAGDVFTRITVVTAAIWIILCVGAVKLLSRTDAVDVDTNAPPAGGAAIGQAPADSDGGEAPDDGNGEQPPAETPPPSESSESQTENPDP